MDYNYHTHTFRSHHATGTDEEYIKTAISGGIKYMGFSDHSPFKCEDGYESLHKVYVADANEYTDTISKLREKYKNEIDIKIGFEMEYYPDHFDGMLKTIKEYGAEYLILGQHFLSNEHDEPRIVSTTPTDIAEHLEKYVKLVIEAMETKVFSYVAHPDIFNFIGDTAVYTKEMRKLCIASRELNIPLEINFLGIRDKRHYPIDSFWKIAGEENSPVTFGFDAHTAESAYDGVSLKIAESIVKKHNLNYIGKPDIILLNK